MADANIDDEREEELSSITAIFPELIIDPERPFTATIDIPVSPSPPLAILFPSATDGAPPAPAQTGLPVPPSSGQVHLTAPVASVSPPRDVHYLSHLPPLRLTVSLPDGYPAEKPLRLEIHTTPSWLPEDAIDRVSNEGANLWEEFGRGQVVFAFLDFLQNEAERGFGLVSAEADALQVSQDMKIELLDFDIKTKRRKFEVETFDCGVCLEPKKGSVCYRLAKCGHVFCVACLQDFYNNCISEGDVSSVKCVDPSCGKENSGRRRKKPGTLNPSELLQIPLQQETVKRFVELKRKKKLESDKTTIYCPRKWCQGPARSKKYPKLIDPLAAEALDSDSEEESPPPPPPTAAGDAEPDPASVDRVAICEDCNFAFCRICLASWHGDYVRCWPRSAAEVSEDEKMSYDYIRMHTSPCPTCSSPCQKTHGCNHMSCFQCHTHFCYLCSSWLDPHNPYQHFNKKGHKCYMRLWEMEEGDEGEGGARFGGARGWEAVAAAAAEEDEAHRADTEAEAPADGADLRPRQLDGGIVVEQPLRVVRRDLNRLERAVAPVG